MLNFKITLQTKNENILYMHATLRILQGNLTPLYEISPGSLRMCMHVATVLHNTQCALLILLTCLMTDDFTRQ
jgi:hypothetical protein